jgi:hypothetical protein
MFPYTIISILCYFLTKLCCLRRVQCSDLLPLCVFCTFRFLSVFSLNQCDSTNRNVLLTHSVCNVLFSPVFKCAGKVENIYLWDLFSSGMLTWSKLVVIYQFTDVSGYPIISIFKIAVLNCLTLEDPTDRLSRNVGK